ncbi:MAG: hypothetical protein J7L46_03055 [Bacteroidales bacterium]|nr:hypothetical protein [Bacteroidales bacterium]
MRNLFRSLQVVALLFFVLNANSQNATLLGDVHLLCDSTTPVQQAHLKIWWLYDVAPDTIFISSDSLGNYTVYPFKIDLDPDTPTGFFTHPNERQITITNNPGQSHRFMLPTSIPPKGDASIYDISGKQVVALPCDFQSGVV